MRVFVAGGTGVLGRRLVPNRNGLRGGGWVITEGRGFRDGPR